MSDQQEQSTTNTSPEESIEKPIWGMITDYKQNRYYSGYVLNEKPQGFGVMLSKDLLIQGLWIDGQFITGFTYELEEMKFGFCLAKTNDPEAKKPEEGSSE